MVDASDVVALVGTLVWPVLIGLVLVLYRKSIRDFASKVAPRFTGVAFGPVSFQFAVAKGTDPKFTSMDAKIDARSTGIENIQSYLSDLVAQIQDTAPLDYAVFDLGDGKRWLTSRLYLFSYVFQ